MDNKSVIEFNIFIKHGISFSLIQVESKPRKIIFKLRVVALNYEKSSSFFESTPTCILLKYIANTSRIRENI